MRARKWIQISAFPLAASALTVVLFGFPGKVVPAYAALVGLVLFGILLERIIPYHTRWNDPQGDLRVDAAHAFGAVIIGPLSGAFGTWAVLLLQPVLPHVVHPLDWPLEIQVTAALVVSGFLPYWLHRLAHETDGVLWRAHAVHHSAERVYWLNSLRLHPLNIIWNSSGLLTALVLGFSADAVFIAGVLNNFVSIYNHLNADLRLGPLNLLFNMNELHRWHHSRTPAEGNANYSGGALNIWDTIFGTRLLPGHPLPPDAVGLFDSASYPSRSYARQLLFPLCQCGAG